MGRRWLILGVLMLAQLMDVMDATVVNVALPSAQRDLGFGDGGRQWVVTAYSLCLGGLLLLGGRIVDRIGGRTALLAGLVGFAAASAAGGAAPTFGVLIAARAAQGAFGALLAPAALSLISTTFPDPDDRRRAYGVFGAVTGAGAAVGLLVGGILTEHLSWRWALYVNVPIALVSLVGGAVLVGAVRSDVRPRFDLFGVLTAVGGPAALVYGFDHANTHGWGQATTLTLIAGGFALLGLFVWRQATASAPLLPLRILADRRRGGAYVMFGLAPVAMFSVFLFLVYYLQGVHGFSPLQSGAAFLPMVGGLVIGVGAVSGGPLAKVAPRTLMVAGALVATSGMLVLSRLTGTSSYPAHVVPALILCGLGVGPIMALATNLATAGVRPADAGVASALLNALSQVGSAMGVALLNTVATRAGGGVEGDARAFLVGAAILIVTAVLGGVVLPGGRAADPAATPQLTEA